MEWEVVNGITGIVSAISGAIGIRYLANTPKREQSISVVSAENISKLVITSSGWALCCLCYFLAAKPFGPFVTDSDYQTFYGWVIACPALIVFLTGCNLLIDKKTPDSHK
jgi:hypothetical protein